MCFHKTLLKFRKQLNNVKIGAILNSFVCAYLFDVHTFFITIQPPGLAGGLLYPIKSDTCGDSSNMAWVTLPELVPWEHAQPVSVSGEHALRKGFVAMC